MSTADERPIVLRRQGRPAPSHGPGHAPRPPVTAATAPKPIVGNGARPRTGSARMCDRCHRQVGDYRFVAASRCAEKFMPELAICAGCLQAFGSFLRAYENKVRQRAAAASRKEQP